jgi:ribosomal protein L32
MEFLLLIIILGGIVAAVAHSMGRSAVCWFLLGFFFFIPALIALLIVDSLVECPKCHAKIKKGTVFCSNCGEQISPPHVRRQ